MAVLRPMLYDRLRARLGEVRIAHEGEAMVAHPGDYQGKRSLQVSAYGEVYRVCCPFCGDTRFRLWINHMWGHYNDQVKSRHLWMARCYNNDACMEDFANVRRLDDEIWSDVQSGRGRLAADVVLQGEIYDPDAMMGKASPPGELVYLSELPANHAARRYMESRDYDPDVYSRELGISYCPFALPQFPRAQERIIIPVVMDGEMKGWQARLIHGKPSKFNPKYDTMKGMKKSLALYNYDNAKHSPFVVVFEGPTKVWRFGRESVAILGNKASGWQTQKLAYWGREQRKPIIIMLDGNAQDGALELYDALRGLPYLVMIPLEPGIDPGDFTTPHLRGMVYEHAMKAGIQLPI